MNSLPFFSPKSLHMKSTTSVSELNRACCTGIQGLDHILKGGLPRSRIHLIEGDPGTGKTTLALQFLLEGIRQNEKGLYITLSETKDELIAVAASHGWSLDGMEIFELSPIESKIGPESITTLFHPSEIELNEVTQALLREVERTSPSRLVLDSLSELRLLSQNSLRYRRQILALKQFFANRGITVLLLDDNTSEDSNQHVHSLAHGVISLHKLTPGYGIHRRHINTVKLRGVDFIGGNHDFIIRKGGMVVFPRLVASDSRGDFKPWTLPSKCEGMDLLLKGGLDAGTSNLFLGPSGSGKSTLAMKFLHEALSSGVNCAAYIFDETSNLLLNRTASLGMDSKKYIENKQFHLCQVDPAELSPGEMTYRIQEDVARRNVKVVLIDSLNGYMNAMPDEKHLLLQLHELFTYLNHHGVVTILVAAQTGVVGTMYTPADLTYLADTVVMLRFFEAQGALKQSLSVLKKRSGDHERSIREFKIDQDGIRVGAPLSGFHGILSGTPQYQGQDAMLPSREPR